MHTNPLITPTGQLLIIEGDPGTGKSYYTAQLAHHFSLSHRLQILKFENPSDTSDLLNPTIRSIDQARKLIEDPHGFLPDTILIIEEPHTREEDAEFTPEIQKLLQVPTLLTVFDGHLNTKIQKNLSNRTIEYCTFRTSRPEESNISYAERTAEENLLIQRLKKGEFLHRSATGKTTLATAPQNIMTTELTH